MVPNVIPEQTISIIKKEVIKYKQYLHLFEIKKALLGPADYDLRTFLDQYLPHMQIDFPAIVANLNSIITNQKRILQNEIIDFNGLCEFYKNVVRYNPQAGNIKKALEELYTNTDKCRQVLHKLWVNLLKQENQLKDLQKYWLFFKGAITEEEKILQEEYGFMQKEREEITEIEKEEKLEVPAEEAAPALDKILSASTIFLYSNSTDFQIPGYYQFSQGVYLRLVLHPGFKKIIIKTEKEFFEWNAYVDTLMRIAQSKFVGKNWACGTWQKDFNYFAFTFGAGTDHVGRSAFATIALVYPAQFEPQMKKICENNKKRIELQNMLKNIIQSKR